jgi:hypothetical protein
MEALSLKGTVAAVACGPNHRFNKSRREAINLIAGHGVEGDAHAGAYVRHRYLVRRNPRAPNLRQVHLLPGELFEALEKLGYHVSPGDLGENVTTARLNLERFPLGTLLRLGPTAAVELTGLRTPCVLIDRFQTGLKNRMINGNDGPPYRCGVMGIVRAGGPVRPGDEISVLLPDGSRAVLPAL